MAPGATLLIEATIASAQREHRTAD